MGSHRHDGAQRLLHAAGGKVHECLPDRGDQLIVGEQRPHLFFIEVVFDHDLIIWQTKATIETWILAWSSLIRSSCSVCG